MHSTTNTAPPLAAERPDPPIHVLLRDSAAAESLAQDLRQHGLRVRTFVSLPVLMNSAKTQPPAAVLVELSLLRDARAGLELATELGRLAGAPVPLIYVDDESDFELRLRAVQAGGSAFFPLPVNQPTLLQHLRQHVGLPASAPAIRVVALGDVHGSLAGPIAELGATGVEVRATDDPAQLLLTLAEADCDLLMLGASAGGVDAAACARVVRQTGTYYSLPILVLTDGDKRELDAVAIDAGIDALVGLPVAAKDLAAIVQAKVSRAQGLRAAYGYSARRVPATGLSTFEYFSESLRHALREGGQAGALLYLTLAFSPDERRSQELDLRLIAYVAEALRPLLPPFALASQAADDSIAILLPAAEPAQVERLAHDLAACFGELDFSLGQRRFKLLAQVGVTLLGGRHRDAGDALAHARDAAMLQPGGPAPTTAAEKPAAEDRWLAQIEEALRGDRLRLVYQPVASLSGQPTPYYEVFLRMLDAHGGDILPQEFLPAAARAGLAPAIDRWVVNRALHVLEEQKAMQHKPVLFVKLSGDTVGDPRFGGWLSDCLSTIPVEPDRLVLQVTQRTLVTRPTETAALVRKLREVGCLFAIEHFNGDSNTSQELMKTLAPQFIKLSPQLTHDIGSNVEHQKQVQAVSGFCRSIDARTVAALVQDAINLSVLWRCGVEYIQGYFMQEPVDVFSDEALS